MDAIAVDPELELASLIERVGRRDELAMRTLYGLAAPRLMGLAMRWMRQRDAAEDVVQEVFVSIWRIAGDYQPCRSPATAWMSLIVRSRAIEALRRRRSERHLMASEFDERMDDTLPSAAPEPTEVLGAVQQLQVLHSSMALLERRQRVLVTLAFLQEMTHAEIADEFQIPIGTVKTMIRRSLLRLRDCLTAESDAAQLALRFGG